MTFTHHQADIVYALVASAPATFIAGRASGLYRSADAGITWQPLIGGPAAAVQPVVSTIAIAACEQQRRTMFVGGQGSVLRSSDDGQTWQACVLPAPPPLITSLAVSPDFVHDSVVLAGTAEDGVFRSVDRGDRWASWNFGLLDLRILALALSPAFATDEMVFAATETGLFRSTNGARAWREIALSANDDSVLSLALSPDFGVDGLIYAGMESGGLFRSVDWGENWQHLLDVNAGGQPMNALTFISPRSVVIALDDRLLLLQDAHAAHPRSTPLAHIEDVTALAIGTDETGSALLLVGDVMGGIRSFPLPI